MEAAKSKEVPTITECCGSCIYYVALPTGSERIFNGLCINRQVPINVTSSNWTRTQALRKGGEYTLAHMMNRGLVRSCYQAKEQETT